MASRQTDDRSRSRTTGEPFRRTDQRAHLCVRCGTLPPAPELFICGRCEADPATLLERTTVEEQFVDYVLARRVLVTQHGWRGGWWRP